MLEINHKKLSGFIRGKLKDSLTNDVLKYFVFNESDIKSAAYFYIRKYYHNLKSENSSKMLIRCEPKLNNGKPDIVIFKKYNPFYIIEIKAILNPDAVCRNSEKGKVEKDLKKIKNLKKEYPSIKRGFSIVIYDSDEDPVDFSDSFLRKKNFKGISIVKINLRRNDNARKRKNYQKWRRKFEKIINKHHLS